MKLVCGLERLSAEEAKRRVFDAEWETVEDAAIAINGAIAHVQQHPDWLRHAIKRGGEQYGREDIFRMRLKEWLPPAAVLP